LRGVADVILHDRDPQVAAEAVARGGGRRWNGDEPATTVVIAVPPSATAAALLGAQRLNLGRTYTHVSSVQSQVQREIEALSSDLPTVVGGHPLAGSESSGPGAATGDLFVGRPWAVCAGDKSSDVAVQDVHELATACGAVPIELDADAHDAAVALLSHLPQVVASALAGRLVGPPGS
jgi:prephenate dehydrogenase